MEYNKYIKFRKNENGDDIAEINCNVFDEFYKAGRKFLEPDMFIVETANERLTRAKKQREKELQFSQYLFDKIEKIWWTNFKNKHLKTNNNEYIQPNF